MLCEHNFFEVTRLPRGAWGSAPNPGAAPPQERTTGGSAPRPPLGLRPRPRRLRRKSELLGALPPDPRWGSAPDPVGAPPHTPLGAPPGERGLGRSPSGGLGAEPPVVRSCGGAAPGFRAEPQAPRAPPLLAAALAHVRLVFIVFRSPFPFF